MKQLLFLRHFQPKIDTSKPASEWSLDEAGTRRMNNMIESGKFADIEKIFSSTEKKAEVTALAIARKHGIPVVFCDEITEVKRGESGHVEGDYEKVVVRYLSESGDFEYPWEKISHVRDRALRFIRTLERETGNLLVISHGMFLSVLLSKYFDRDIVSFWKGLAFGQLLEVDFEELKSVIYASHQKSISSV